jgi:hypothetical protein
MEYHPSGTVTVDGSGMAQAGNACGRNAWCTSPTLTATADDLQVTFGGNCSWGQVISFNPAMNARANSGTCMYVVDGYVPSTTSTFQYGSFNAPGFPVDMQTVTFKSTP